VVSGNTMIQGAATQNSNMFACGEEGLTYPTNSLAFINNTMQNTLANATGIFDPSGVPVIGSGNSFDPSITTQVNPPSANQLTGTSFERSNFTRWNDSDRAVDQQLDHGGGHVDVGCSGVYTVGDRLPDPA